MLRLMRGAMNNPHEDEFDAYMLTVALIVIILAVAFAAAAHAKTREYITRDEHGYTKRYIMDDDFVYPYTGQRYTGRTVRHEDRDLYEVKRNERN